jgi:hypothetical protein
LTHEPVHTLALLADHGQFHAHDSSVQEDALPEFSDDAVRRGWTRTDKTIYYFTVGQSWRVRLDLIRGDGPPPLDKAEHVLSHTLRLPTGNLVVGNSIAAENVITLSLEPGTYSLFLRAFNLGVESDENLGDPSFLTRSDLERYELFVVDGAASAEGLILGKPTLW